MVKGRGKIKKVDGVLYQDELQQALSKLPDNQDFEFVIVDKAKNRTLPCTTYLFSVVLPQIAEQLPEHPATAALYRYFEDMFAPLHSSKINGEDYDWYDLKRERTLIVNEAIEKIIDFVKKEWGISVMSQADLMDANNSELYAEAYKEQEVGWSKFLSHQHSNLN